jgi:transposase
MAKLVETVNVGIDVSKDELVIARSDSDRLEPLPNRLTSIRRWLKTLPEGTKIALESTGIYHRKVAELAHQQGHQLFILDNYRLSKYRESIGERAKTDPSDARLILRYLRNEYEDLKPWVPPPAAYTRIQALQRRRARLVQMRVALNQTLQDLPELRTSARTLAKHLDRAELLIQKLLKDSLKEVGWWHQAKLCMAVEGIGELTAMALANTFHRGHFKNSDAFIAFMGMDVRVRDSGKKIGRRKLTKKGDPELRRLLYNAAMAARKTATWACLYEQYLTQGLKPTQALIKLARKLARIAFSLMKNESTYVTKTA